MLRSDREKAIEPFLPRNKYSVDRLLWLQHEVRLLSRLNSISQRTAAGFVTRTDPEQIVKNALDALNNIGIAFTYNEPVIWLEYIRDVALLAKNNGLRTVMVSNGYVNREPS